MVSTSNTLRISRIEDPIAARMVTDPTSRSYLEPLMVRERSARQLADAVGVPLSTAIYRIKGLIECGLIAETRREPRAGRPIRYFRAAASGFFVPFTATPLEAEEALAPEVFRLWQDRLTSSIGRAWVEACGGSDALGFRIYVGEAGLIHRDIVPLDAPDGAIADPEGFFVGMLAREAPAVWDDYGTLALLPEDAKDLQREIAGLLTRYRSRERPGARKHLVRLAMAPVVEPR